MPDGRLATQSAARSARRARQSRLWARWPSARRSRRPPKTTVWSPTASPARSPTMPISSRGRSPTSPSRASRFARSKSWPRAAATARASARAVPLGASVFAWWCSATISAPKLASRRRAARLTSAVSTVTPTLMLGASTVRVRAASAASSRCWPASRPVGPITTPAPRSAARRACTRVAAGAVKSRTTCSARQTAPRSSPTRTPTAAPPAASPASRPTAGWPAASIAPATRSRGSSRASATRSRPMRPATPQTTMGSALGALGSDELVLVQHRLEPDARPRAHGHEREAELVGAPAHHAERGLHRDRVHLERERLHEGEQAVVQHPAALQVAREERVGQLDVGARHQVGTHRDHAVAARGHDGERQDVVARVDPEVRPRLVDDLEHLRQVPARLLHARDVRDFREARDRLGRGVRAGAARDVVEDERQPGRVGDRGIVAVDAVLRRPVVVGRDQEGGGRARLLRAAREPDGLRRRVGAGARDDRHAPACGAHHLAHDRDVLLVRQGRGLARRPAGDEGVDAARDLRLDQRVEGLDVNLAGAEGGDQGRHGAGEHRYTPTCPPKTSTASPVLTTRSPRRQSISSSPPRSATTTRRPPRPVRAAAPAAAHAPVPHAMVSPAPRSHTRISSRSGPSARTNSVFTPRGKNGWRAKWGPRSARGRPATSPSTNTTQCGFPIETQVTV